MPGTNMVIIRRNHCTSLRGLVRMAMASFQPSSTMATIAHSGGSRLLAALFASWVFTACKITQHDGKTDASNIVRRQYSGLLCSIC